MKHNARTKLQKHDSTKAGAKSLYLQKVEQGYTNPVRKTKCKAWQNQSLGKKQARVKTWVEHRQAKIQKHQKAKAHSIKVQLSCYF